MKMELMNGFTLDCLRYSILSVVCLIFISSSVFPSVFVRSVYVPSNGDLSCWQDWRDLDRHWWHL